jgi:AcrR family transcriptional regulator
MSERTRRQERPDRRRPRHDRAQHSAERSARQEQRRDDLREAAIAAIRRHGAGVSMDQIAAEAGITKPIIYRHFGDRRGLVMAIAHQFVVALNDEISGSLTQESTSSEELLRRTVDTYLAFVERDPEVYRFLVRSALGEVPDATDRLGGFIRQISAQIALVVGERLREAGHDSGMAEPWAHALVGAVHQAGDWWLDRATLPRPRLVDYLMALLWNGLASFDPAAD